MALPCHDINVITLYYETDNLWKIDLLHLLEPSMLSVLMVEKRLTVTGKPFICRHQW